MNFFSTVALMVFPTMVFSQILGHPGATWIFEDWVGGNLSVWTYEGDSLLNGESVRYIKQENKNRFSTDYGHFTKHHFFKESNDTVWEWMNQEWFEVCNLSLPPGSQVPSPLYRANQMQGASVCYDETIASIPARVHISSINTESGIPLRYYLLRFVTDITGTDTAYAAIGYQERMLLYYYSVVPYLYYFNPGCPTESAMNFSCYFDNDIPAGESCLQLLSQFTQMDVPENGTMAGVAVYPNPTQGEFSIDIGTQPGQWEWSLYTGDGKFAMAGNLSVPQVDASGLVPGIYFLLLTDGQRRVWEKILKN